MCIPHVGTFELVQQPPQLNIGEKLISAPFFTTSYMKSDSIPEHQFNFIASAGGTGKEELKNDLSRFGESLRNHIRTRPFQWNGFGTLRYASNEIVFEPKEIGLSSMAPAQAEKVMRENVQHNVLVGDRHIISGQESEQTNKAFRKQPLFILIGWALLALAVITIIILLYLGKFQVSTSGLKWKISGW